MADTKLLTEICDALINGIRTTNKIILDNLYKSKNDRFPEQTEFDLWITDAVETIRRWTGIHNTSITKPYIIYSLILAMRLIPVHPGLQNVVTVTVDLC